MNLKMKLILFFTCIVVVAAGPLSVISMTSIKNQANHDIQELMSSKASETVNQLDGWTRGNSQIIETLSAELQSSDIPSDAKVTSLKTAFQHYKDQNISNIYAGFEDGTYWDGSGWFEAGYDPRTRPWYKDTIAKGDIYYSSPYIDAASSNFTVSIAHPLKDSNGSIIGVVSEDILLNDMTKIIKDINLNGLGYAFLIDQNGVVVAHPDNKLAGKNLKDTPELGSSTATLLSASSGKADYSYNGSDRQLYFKKMPSTGWIVGLSISKDIAFQEYYSTRNQLIIAVAIIFVVAMLLAVWAANSFIKPILKLQMNVKRVAEGDMTTRVDIKGKDEIASLGTDFNLMSDNLSNLLRKVADTAADVSSASHDMHQHAKDTGTIASQISSAVQELAQGASDQAEAVYSGSEKLTHMTDSINQIGESVKRTQTAVFETDSAVLAGYETAERQAKLAAESRQTTTAAGEAVDSLTLKTQDIERLAGAIHDIAAQTNLLALNASIEAARAGEHGRGFAVVAGEVRKLAEQAGSSSDSIMNKLEEIKLAGVRSAEEMKKALAVTVEQEQAAIATRQAFESIRGASQHMLTQIEDVSAASDHLRVNAGHISDVISSVVAVSEQSAASTEEVASSVQEQGHAMNNIATLSAKLDSHADLLLEEVKRFKL
ncbi:methyl-accepting chemotaxis protein [Paenibacillus farraposensis]|uniref:Methyl-accepting chemotaxis protein n=1 Tax=Paenibacillus farraposensis TaxID=2807095 RepID=A0ABW4DE86_9BACL|nr:methyl-accepting chemotaxis protein [Paenibacillus farraposensis]MCC3378877.1 methyl-accepting chemotaxis protein [Paenibacillus farraposensis]